MKIRTRLNLSTYLSLAVMLLMICFVAWSLVNESRTDNNLYLMQKMQKNSLERTVLRDEYLLTHGQRITIQWKLKTEELRELLKLASDRLTQLDESNILKEAKKNFEMTTTIFSRIVDIHTKELSTEKDRRLFIELENRLSNQLFLKAYSLNNDLTTLEELFHKKSKSMNVRVILSIIIFVTLAFITTIFNSFEVNRILKQRIEKLSEGIQIIGNGNLDYRIDIKGDDELSDLARLSNAITDKLQKSFTSIENLQKEITERLRAEETLRESEEKFRNLFNNSGVAMFRTRLDGSETLEINEKFLEIVGRTRAETKGTPSVIFWEEPKERDEMVRRLVANGRVSELEFRMLNKQGGVRDCITSLVLYREQGILEGTIIDITERKQAEEALKRLQQHHQLILSSAAEGILGLDLEGTHVFVNPAAAKMLGYEVEELIGSPSHAIWHHTGVNGSPYPEEECPIYETLTKGTPYFGSDEVFWRKDGTSFPVDYATVPITEDGKVCGSVLTFWDISQRREAEEAFRSLVSHAPMGIFLIQGGKFIVINPGFETITGYPKEELLGQESECLATPSYKEKVRREVVKRLKRESSTPFEIQFITKSGETRWGIETVASTHFAGKRATLGYFMDITEHKQLEEQFLQAQKMEAVGTLAGGIAHDFNNILTVILGNISLAALDDKIGIRVKNRLAQAEKACFRAQVLSQQLLTFAKGGAPVKKLFSLAELLTESTAFACVGSPVRCETTFPENLWSIEGDPGQIGQIFQNITINAIQAMPVGGTIKVWAENLTLGIESSLPLSAGKYIRISVRDQGMGIPAEHLPRIFDPYFTTKQKGSGLGLASAYAIVNKHHGHIAVESKPGVGTTFDIYLPAAEQQATPQPPEDRELLVGTGKILVMDDEGMVREVLGRMIASLGYEAEFARDGGEALEMFIKAQGSGQAFAVVILDLTVPGAMGGKEALEKLLEIDPQAKTIVSSGYSDDPIMADFQKYGFSGVIAKPYKISELGKILHEVIMGKP